MSDGSGEAHGLGRRAIVVALLAVAAWPAIVTGSAAAAQPPGPPTALTVRDQARPLNVEGAPQFGWLPSSSRGDDVQTGYQIRVSASGDVVWDSGKVSSSEQSYVAYGGPALDPGESYDWTVRTWDAAGNASPWAPPAHFETGLGDGGWSGAQWIRRVTTGNDFTDDYTLARRQVDLGASPVVRARAYVSALGQYELHINGRAVHRGDSFGYPGEGQYAAVDITDDVQAGRPLAVGVLYHYWTCTCQGRANGRVSNTTLAAAAAAGDTTLKVGSVLPFDIGDRITVGSGASAETATVTAVGTAGAGGTGITIGAPLGQAHATGNATPVYDHMGPSGLLVKVVVDHADGTRETVVSDGEWKVAKAEQFTNETVTFRDSDSGDRVERYDARREIAGWDRPGFDDGGWSAPAVIGPHPRPVERLRDTFSHLDPAISDLRFETVHPRSVTRLEDGTVVADFGVVIPAAPRIALRAGADGRALTMRTSYRLNHATLAAPAAAGDASVKVSTVTGFAPGDRITVDAPANGHGAGDPERRTVVAVGTAGADGTGIALDSPLERAHAADAWVEGSRAGDGRLDRQAQNMTWQYTEKDGPQTAGAFTHWGWRYLQVDAPGAGETLTKDDIAAVVQHTDVPDDRAGQFHSDNPTLDRVFDLMQRSSIYSSQETFVDTPTREKGQFLGDTVDISYATMLGWGERNATARAIREFVYSADHVWKAPGGNYCTAAQVPCSYASIGTPGRLNAVYPNGDNMRDIPDYTEFFPGWVMRYYEASRDAPTLTAAYPTMQSIAAYIHGAEATSGGTAGLVTNLFGGAGPYQFGIIDWPAPMRYGYTVEGNAARTIHNAEAVGAFRATADAARALGRAGDAAQYDAWADELAAAINAKLRRPDGLYSDGLSGDAGNPQIANAAQHAQTYPVYYDIVAPADRDAVADYVVGQGMRQGPMTWHVLLAALAKSGRYDQVVRLLTDPRGDGPAKILAQGGTFMWEQWNPGCATGPCTTPIDENGNESFSHGWGSWGVVDVLESLLGVSLTSPGAATVRIAPPSLHTADLTTARGSVWTQRGRVEVRWRRGPRGMTVEVTVPTNVEATVAIPADGATQYRARGEGGAAFEGFSGGRAVFRAGSGRTVFDPAAAG
jgi:hypothetical protein